MCAEITCEYPTNNNPRHPVGNYYNCLDFVPILQLPVPIFLSARLGDPAPLEQPAKPSKQSEPLEGKEVLFKSQQEMGPHENGETGDGRVNGAAATEEDGEGEDDSNLLIYRLKNLHK